MSVDYQVFGVLLCGCLVKYLKDKRFSVSSYNQR